jgi:hypothetical protein
MKRISLFTKIAHFIVICACMLTGCVEEYEADLPEGETNLLVVNGTIRSNEKSEFYLTRSIPLNDHSSDYYYVNDSYTWDAQTVYYARVTICGTDGSEYACEIQDNGYYSCDTPALNPDVAYYVRIEYDDDIYQSEPEKPLSTPDIDELEYYQKGDWENIEILLTTAEPDDPTQTAYYTWDYTETWEVRPTRQTSVYFDLEAMTAKYLTQDMQYPSKGWKIADSKAILTESTAHYVGGKFTKYQLLDISYKDERIAWNYCNEVTQRAISKAEYEYNKACVEAGWEMGGLFTPQPSSLPSNIRCTTSSKRAIGYVGCSLNTASKRVYIDGEKIYREVPQPGPYIKLPDCSEYDCEEMVYQGMILYIWDDRRMIYQPLTTYWAYPADFDIRLSGATTTKPDYMPPFN